MGVILSEGEKSSPEPTCPLSFPTSTVLWERAGAELSGGEALASPSPTEKQRIPRPGNLEFIQQRRRVRLTYPRMGMKEGQLSQTPQRPPETTR
jgi:hypothetical protein